MILLTEIIDAAARALRDKYAVYSDPPRQVPEGVARYLVISVIPITSAPEGTILADTTVMVDIANAGDDDITQAEYLQFIWDCDAAFRPTLAFGDRVIMPQEITSNTTDGIGHYIMHLRFFDVLKDALDQTTPPTMADIEIRSK